MRKGQSRSPEDLAKASAGASLDRFLTIEGWNRTDFAAAAGLTPRHLRNVCVGESASWDTWTSVLKIATERARTDEGRRLLAEIQKTLWPSDGVVSPAPSQPPQEEGAPPRTWVKYAALAAGACLVVAAAIVSLRTGPIPTAPPATSAAPVPAGASLMVDGKDRHERPQGETFQLVARGLTPGGEVVRFEEPPRYPKPNQEQSRVILAAAPDGSLSWAATVGCDIAERDYSVWLQDRATGKETNRVVMRVVTNPHCPPPGQGVDFHTTDVVLDRQSARVGEAVGLKFVIKNVGTVTAPTTEARVRWGLAQTLNPHADPLLARVEVPALAAGHSYRPESTVVVPARSAGTYVVWVVADATSITLEAESANNFAKSALIEILPGAPRKERRSP
jgi:hypothetical protein